MLAELKFVMGAIAKKDFLPALTHFVIKDGKVRGFNGTLSLCTPIPINIECKPKAKPLVDAIGRCEDTVQLSLTPAGRLSIKSGAFRALVDCVQEDSPHPEPEGDRVELNGEALLAALKAVVPFIGDDASRPWSNGVLLSGQSAFATNNVMLVEYWVASTFPHVVNVPRAAVKEMVRINEAPTHAQMTESSMTFHYPNGRWIRTQLYETKWPDLSKILNAECNPQPIDPLLFKGLDVIKPFLDKMGRVYFNGGQISTHIDSSEGATYDVPDLQNDGLYNLEMLASLDGIAQTIDFNLYPKACIFYGERLRGAIIGMRK